MIGFSKSAFGDFEKFPRLHVRPLMLAIHPQPSRIVMTLPFPPTAAPELRHWPIEHLGVILALSAAAGIRRLLLEGDQGFLS